MATTKRRTTRRTPFALALLRQDHRRVERLLAQFERLGGDHQSRQALAETLCNELTVHADLEEMELYPVARQALAETGLVNEAEVEHAVAKSLVEQVRGMSAEDELFDARVTVLGEYVRHHIGEEERELFPELLRAGVDFQEMAARMVERQRQLRLSLGLPPDGAVRMPPRRIVTALTPRHVPGGTWHTPLSHVMHLGRG